MKKFATLGPRNTFSEHASRYYCELLKSNITIELFSSFPKVFGAVGSKCTHAVLPIENMIEGYVQPVLDLMIKGEQVIVDEFMIPIQFSFVANCETLNKVKRIFVQFVTQGQCANFIENNFCSSDQEVEVITTPSNGKSFESVLAGEKFDGAIVPSFAIGNHQFELIQNDVHDVTGNVTRFVVLGKEEATLRPAQFFKTSIVIIEGADYPGMLSDALAAFSSRNINLLSIISRPTKESLGKYFFFVDFMGHIKDPLVSEAISEIRCKNEIKFLGTFPAALELPHRY